MERRIYPGWAGHPDGFLQVNPGWAGHPDGFNLEGVALKDMTLVGGIRLNYKGFKAESLMPVVFTKEVLQKYLVYNRG
jgi:hypothetical protein